MDKPYSSTEKPAPRSNLRSGDARRRRRKKPTSSNLQGLQEKSRKQSGTLAVKSALVDYLDERARHYLARYAATELLFRRYLNRRAVQRLPLLLRQHVPDLDEPPRIPESDRPLAEHESAFWALSNQRARRQEIIDEVVQEVFDRFLPWVQTEPYIRSRAHRLLQRGYGERHIRADLLSRGASKAVIDQIIEALTAEHVEEGMSSLDDVAVGNYMQKMGGDQALNSQIRQRLLRRGINKAAIRAYGHR